MKETKDFENKLKKLEQIVSKLENDDNSLEETVSLFNEGMKLTKECRMTLEKVEQSVSKVIELDEEGVPKTEAFDNDDIPF